MGFEEIQVEGQILQRCLHPAELWQSQSASLSNSEGEKHACTTQADVPQPTGTRSGKSYLRQHEKATDETQ